MLYEKFLFLRYELIGKRLPTIEPLMKLVPIMKLMGNFIDSSIIKLTLDLFELFWIPIINIQNKLKLKVKLKKNFLKGNNIYF